MGSRAGLLECYNICMWHCTHAEGGWHRCDAGLEGFQSLLQKTADGVYTTSSQWHLVLTVVFHGSVKLTVRAGIRDCALKSA